MRKLLVLLSLVIFSGCQETVVQMGATEYGVRYANLPTFMGGGISSNVAEPGSWAVVLPWERLLTFDSSVKTVSWGTGSKTQSGTGVPFITTRAVDGNEVALSVTIRYQIRPDQAGLTEMVRHVATTDEGIDSFVKVSASSVVRTFMNELHTSEYLNTAARYRAVDAVRDNLRAILGPFNVEVQSVQLDDFRFERVLADGSIDASYQEKLNETQRIREEIDRERARIETVEAKKQQEFNDVQAHVNRQIAEADGYKKQAVSRGNSYLEARKNEAKGVRAQGVAEAKGITEKVQSLSGPGGRAILKLEMARELAKSNARFAVVGGSSSTGAGGQSLDVRRTDVNEIMEQVGVFEALREPAIKEVKTKTASDPKRDAPVAEEKTPTPRDN